jgi:ankyrin repeat protein
MVLAGGEYGTALQAASYHGELNIVTLLLEKGANPNAQGADCVIPRMYTDMVPAGGKYGTPLHAALDRGDLKIITLLLDNGADPNAQGASFAIPKMCDSHGTCRRPIRDGPSSSRV